MSSIKIKDDTGVWVYAGGTAPADITWNLVTSFTQIVPAAGGYYAIASTVNDQGYTFIILPSAPANGTIVGVQVLDNSTAFAYLQASGTDTIDYQVTAVLTRNQGQLLERVRYYNGKWFRLDGSYPYTPPPQVGAYKLSPLSAEVVAVSPALSPVAANSAIEVSVTITPLVILTLP